MEKLKKMGCRAAALCLLLSVCWAEVPAQSFAEFFKQKKTQRKYLLEQIAALQTYLAYARKGYELVGDGLGLVRDLSNGEFSLHAAFISSLKSVSPFIRDNVKVAEIISWQVEISRGFSALGPPGLLPVSDQLYISEVRAGVLAGCGADLEELLMIISPGRLEMRDQERLVRLNKLYLSVQDKAAFTRSFCSEVALLAAARQREQNSIHFLNKLYGVIE